MRFCTASLWVRADSARVRTARSAWAYASGAIGRRYRRQDEIGTPFCVTYDFDSLEDGAVTVRERDTMEQERFLAAVQNLENLTDLSELNVVVTPEALASAPKTPEGLF